MQGFDFRLWNSPVVHRAMEATVLRSWAHAEADRCCRTAFPRSLALAQEVGREALRRAVADEVIRLASRLRGLDFLVWPPLPAGPSGLLFPKAGV